ncbi:DUF3078 domain-containing protein [Roseivirga sp. E12]|uniref:DUF3078 domain-containing protein n=1 Tax=Roseivirga sp. E12 TaxID=2819237 RepID=UPI001ABC9A3F|nr:DUF3078 domain-containing protein [Roseivirga sp. E12]MBO3700430.1 DUF3078 domain-containing protein [Roseivirga sp. E12]
MSFTIFCGPKRLLLIFLFSALGFAGFAQEKPTDKDTTVAVPDSLIFWKKGGKLNVTVQQVGLTNWAAGGESSVAVGGGLEGFINYEEGTVVWENKAQIGYGVIRNGGGGNRFEKTDDAVVLSSKYSQKFSEKVLMTSAVNFRTQMDRGYKIEKISGTSDTRRTLISDFMAPGYLQASLGLTFRDSKKGYTATLAPFTGRFTFVLNDSLSEAGAFGITPNDKIRSEAGISLRGGVQKDIMENVKFQANFNLFSNYEKFPNTVVNVEAVLNLKVNDFIQSNISTQLIYDDDVIITRSDGSQGRDLQIKNVINVGFVLGF